MFYQWTIPSFGRCLAREGRADHEQLAWIHRKKRGTDCTGIKGPFALELPSAYAITCNFSVSYLCNSLYLLYLCESISTYIVIRIRIYTHIYIYILHISVESIYPYVCMIIMYTHICFIYRHMHIGVHHSLHISIAMYPFRDGSGGKGGRRSAGHWRHSPSALARLGFATWEWWLPSWAHTKMMKINQTYVHLIIYNHNIDEPIYI